MAKNLLVINVDIRETRVALIENGIIVELQIERHSSRGTLGNIYLGKVSRVLPGMQAAFIDIGEERAAFLHVEDLIRPDDFEAYLSGHRHGAAKVDEAPVPHADVEDVVDAEPAPSPDGAQALEEGDAIPEDDEDEVDEEALGDGEAGEREVRAADERLFDGDAAEATPAETNEDAAWADEDDAPEEDAGREDAVADGAEDAQGEQVGDLDDAEADDEDGADVETADEDGDDENTAAAPPATASPDEEDGISIDLLDDLDLPEVVVEDAPAAGDPSRAAGDEPGQTARRARRGGRSRRRGRTRDRQEAIAAAPAPAPAPAPLERGRGRGRRGGRGGGRQEAPSEARAGGRDGRRPRAKDPLRVWKSTPIREVVREGQEIIVQVSKEPIGTKGARVTSHVSLPGRYVVYLPTVEHIGISKRIGSDKERGRLREAIEAMKPPQGGLIVRTLAEGLTKKSLKQDVGYLVRLWGEIAKNREEVRKAPSCLYPELDLVLKTARDLFTDSIEKIVIDSKDEYLRLRKFIEVFMPERLSAIELYEGDEPIFDEYGIEDEIGRALSRKVPLPSGGHLIIDQAEALTAIDVNTGRFVGKGSKDLEDTILRANLEAVEEIAYQLRFRNIGGLIILDLIDMERSANREKVRRRLEQLLANDKAKTTLNRISDLGLIEMTRKRTRESLGRVMNEPCFYCDGTGNLQSKQTVAYEILRQIMRERANLRGYSVVVNAHPAVVDLLKNEERAAVAEAERRYQRRIELTPRKEYHLEQFDLVGR